MPIVFNETNYKITEAGGGSYNRPLSCNGVVLAENDEYNDLHQV